MQTMNGKYNEAKIYASVMEDSCKEQIQTLLDQPFVEDEKIRIMADTHAGSGCVIGYTQTIKNKKVCPNLVGVDISCGVFVANLGKQELDLEKLDKVIRENIPCGRNIHEGRKFKFPRLNELTCYRELSADTIHFAERAIATLGGGNHFISVEQDEEGNNYLLVHSGSRNLGKHVAEFHQAMANKLCNHDYADFDRKKKTLIETYKSEGRKTEIAPALIALKQNYSVSKKVVPYDLAYLCDEYFDNYLQDTRILSEYSHLNRAGMAELICDKYGCAVTDTFETLHNYIDTDNLVIRKGAISAQTGEIMIIPINMRDGSLICVGKGNADYNCSAPHGAGRLMSRTKAKETVTLEDFKKSMEGIYTTCVDESTIDESCFAYKKIEDIVPNITDSVDVVKRLKPIYNFKASENYGKV